MMRAPVVTNADRDWALALCPHWADKGAPCDDDEYGEIVDDDGWLENTSPTKSKQDAPNWRMYVAERIEEFEAAFSSERCSVEAWSKRWRGWMKSTDPKKRFPKSAPKEFHPFFRKGTPEFVAALKVATKGEQVMWERFGIAQFKPDDPRLSKISKRTTGDAA